MNPLTRPSNAKRLRIKSADSLETADSLIDHQSQNSKSKKKNSGLKIDSKCTSAQSEDNFNMDLTDSPYYSSMNLPPIEEEEDMESEHGKVFRFDTNALIATTQEDSPF
jgi:hypothetical protein